MRRSRTLWPAILLMAAGLLAFPAWALAQTSTQSGSQQSQSSQEGLETLDVNDPNLKLSSDQKNQIAGINDQRRKDIQAVQGDTSLTREQKQERIREINRAANERIHGTLSAEQRERWQQHRRRDRREDVRDRKEDRRDRREDVRDRREDVRDARHDGGKRDRMEDRRDRREDVRDRKEDRRDRREDRRDNKVPPKPRKRP